MNKILKKTLIAASVAILFLSLYSCSDKSPKDSKMQEMAQTVEVQPVKIIMGSDEIPYSGTIEESESIPLSF